MKNLNAIIQKFQSVSFDSDNYSIGGGLSGEKFASRRHEAARVDDGKMTLGETTATFKKATGLTSEEVKSVIEFVYPNLEWHHAGVLPKRYGGGMKKTYFVNSAEIINLANNWDAFKKSYDRQNDRAFLKMQFLTSNTIPILRVTCPPSFFIESDQEMNGKFGWFTSYGKSYNMTVYYSGHAFPTEELYKQYLNM